MRATVNGIERTACSLDITSADFFRTSGKVLRLVALWRRGGAVKIAPARTADDVAVLADEHPAQERRLDARGELDPFEGRVALRRFGIPGAHRPGLTWVDERQVGVPARHDVAFGIQAE